MHCHAPKHNALEGSPPDASEGQACSRKSPRVPHPNYLICRSHTVTSRGLSLANNAIVKILCNSKHPQINRDLLVLRDVVSNLVLL